jgi:uncharacterized protein HemX
MSAQMKTLLFLLIGITLGGYYYAKEINQYAEQFSAANQNQHSPQTASSSGQPEKKGVDKLKAHSEQTRIEDLLTTDQENAMTIHELSKCQGQNCMNEFVTRNTKGNRTEADKVMNFFARGKYE